MQLSVDDLREILCSNRDKLSTEHPWKVGASYFIRTVTHHYTGRLSAIYSSELVLEDAAWIADDGRFASAVKDGTFNEIEPYVNPVIIGRGSILDATEISFALPRSQK